MANQDSISIREPTFRRICNLAVDHLNYLDVKDRMLADIGIEATSPEELEARKAFRKEFCDIVDQMRTNGRFRSVRIIWAEDN